MADILRYFRSLSRMFLPLAALAVVSCERDDSSMPSPDESRAIPVQIGLPETRAFANDQTHHVDRVLILPFRKSAENLPDDNANYVPAYNYAEQVDVNQFPLGSVTLHLPVDVTFKVLVIGYNHGDYDFTNRTSPANRFDIGSVSAPVNLGNFHLVPKSPALVPEFFVCLADAYDAGNTSHGSAFKANQGYTLKGTLRRLVSGFSVTITNVPAFVKSITLTAENLVKSSRAIDAAATQWQITGDGGNRVLDKKTPANGTVTFSQYLLPTFATYKTGFFLIVEFGLSSQTYTVKANDGPVVSGNRFIFNPNEAINLTGDYTTAINFGFSITYGINLDDDAWDGII